MGALAVCGLVCITTLWSVGSVSTPGGGWMGALLGATIQCGLVLSLRSPPPHLAPGPRRMLRCIGWTLLAAATAFLAGLFVIPDGSVSITRRALPAAAPERLRLVDMNVYHGYPELRDQQARTSRLTAALRALEPTVIVLQEAWSTPRHGDLASHLAAELGMSFAYARANGSRRLIGFEEGSAVLSRLPMLEARRVALSPRRPFWETRIALFVTLALAEGGNLTVIGTHLAAGDVAVADAQARDLAGRLPRGFVIVAGDFNAGSDSGAVLAMKARGFSDLVPSGIDHVFVSRLLEPWRLEGAEWALRPEDLAGEESAVISDHPAIVVDWVWRGESSNISGEISRTIR